MLRTHAAALVCLAGPALAAQPDPEALALLDRTRDAILKIENLSYHCKAYTQGGLFDGMMPTFESEIWQFKSEGNWHLRLKGFADVPQKGQTPFLVVDDGTLRVKIWVDDDKKTVFYRPASMAKRARSEALNMSEYAWLKDLVEKDPLVRDRTAAEALSIEGTTELDNTPCDVVLADFGDQRGQTRWFLAASDHLPRKVEYITSGQGIEFRRVIELSKVNTEAGLLKESFAIATPDGYTREEPPKIDPEQGIVTRVRPEDGALITEHGDVGVRQMPDVVVGLEPGQTAPEFKLHTQTGDEITSSALRGNVVVLAFWSSTLHPCRRSVPELQDLHLRYKDRRFRLIAATCKEKDPDDGAKFLDARQATFTIALNADTLAKTYKSEDVLPTFYVIGYRGEIVHKEIGYKAGDGGTFEMLDAQIEAYFASSGS